MLSNFYLVYSHRLHRLFPIIFIKFCILYWAKTSSQNKYPMGFHVWNKIFIDTCCCFCCCCCNNYHWFEVVFEEFSFVEMSILFQTLKLMSNRLSIQLNFSISIHIYHIRAFEWSATEKFIWFAKSLTAQTFLCRGLMYAMNACSKEKNEISTSGTLCWTHLFHFSSWNIHDWQMAATTTMTQPSFDMTECEWFWRCPSSTTINS